MKQLFFILNILTIAFLSACSSDDLSFPNNEEETYQLRFHVVNPTIETEVSPLRSFSQPRYINSMHVIVFDESGDRIIDYLFTGRVSGWMLEDGSAQIDLSLPKGAYHITFYTIPWTVKDESTYTGVTLIDPYIATPNFFTFYFPDEGTYSYYQSISTTITPSNQTIEQQITLDPMWSNLNLMIDDAQTFDVPQGTEALQFVVSPLYLGFDLQSKKAIEKAPDHYISAISQYRTNIIPLDTIRNNSTFTYPTYVYQTLPENGNLSIDINYLKKENESDYTILETRRLSIAPIVIENGYNYNINGKLGSQSRSQSMNITLGEFNKEDVVIEF